MAQLERSSLCSSSYLGTKVSLILILIVSLWNSFISRFSKTTLEHPDFKIRFAWFVSITLVLITIVWSYSTLGSAYVNVQPEYQWILAFLNPLVREINFKLLHYVTCKAAGSDEGSSGKSIKILTRHYAFVKHAVFLAVIVGGVATPTTNYCIASIDFIEAMFDCLKIIRKYNNGQEFNGKIIFTTFEIPKLELKVDLWITGKIKELVLTERQSLHAFTYLTLIIMAFYGPNAEILGNIKLSIWQFQNPITDINAYLFNIGLWLFVDFFSIIMNGVLLWHFCKINIMWILNKLQRNYWLLFAIAEAYSLMEVCSL